MNPEDFTTGFKTIQFPSFTTDNQVLTDLRKIISGTPSFSSPDDDDKVPLDGEIPGDKGMCVDDLIDKLHYENGTSFRWGDCCTPMTDTDKQTVREIIEEYLEKMF